MCRLLRLPFLLFLLYVVLKHRKMTEGTPHQLPTTKTHHQLEAIERHFPLFITPKAKILYIILYSIG